ncbi:hypothetical protein [Acidisoma sp. L85]|uniref:hypothetical protein n=1 Tax=Acidisoma sp. L85 TaxID=1641850 RepID=UPI00131D80FC|nr:hypothetical protein [Acidisoma sp. L85]
MGINVGCSDDITDFSSAVGLAIRFRKVLALLVRRDCGSVIMPSFEASRPAAAEF